MKEIIGLTATGHDKFPRKVITNNIEDIFYEF